MLSEGFPPGTPSGLAWDAAIARRDRRRDELVSLGFSIAGAVACCFGSAKPSVIARPFYTEREWGSLMSEQEEREQRAAEMQQIEKLRRMSNGF